MTRLLIVDDSALMRRLLGEIFGRDPEFELAVARSGEEALALLPEFKPDVVTLDIHMPGLDGLACLDHIMVEHPCPVVMVSALTRDGAEETVEAMALGAVDVIAKPEGPVSLEIDAIAPALIDKVKAAAQARVPRAARLRERVQRQAQRLAPPATPRPRAPTRPCPIDLVLVGSSTGGPPALDALLQPLPEDFPAPILIAQHMPASFTGPLAARLDRICRIAVRHVDRPTALEPGHAYVAQGEADVILTQRARRLTALPAPASPEHRWHPSVDRMAQSAAAIVPPDRIAAVLLTGMGVDGAGGMAAIHAGGGHTIAEAAETAVIWGMPGALVRLGGAETIAPLHDIADVLMTLVAR